MSDTSSEPRLYNSTEWVEANKQDFLPPVCNKMMHGSQMKCFYVGGPNIRKDYHIEEGEEFFYMVKGDMCLKVFERNEHKDVIIKEGECFLLPAKVPHSPQRQANTVGLVIERARSPNEMDCLRYFVEESDKPTSEILFEKWFHCENLGPQLAAAINEFFDSEQYKTGKPVAGAVLPDKEKPFQINQEVVLMKPFPLKAWLYDNQQSVDQRSLLPLFGENRLSTINVHGAGEWTKCVQTAEVWLWMLEGTAEVFVLGKNYSLKLNDTLWIPVNNEFILKVEGNNSRVFMIYMEPPSPEV